MLNLILISMKKSIQITAQIILWIVFTLLVLVLCKLFLLAKPEAPLSQHLTHVVLLELIMGFIFFYTTFLGIPFARKNNRNMIILSAVLFLLLAFFSFPAMSHGLWQVMSSIIPHIMLIFLALVFRGLTDTPIEKA